MVGPTRKSWRDLANAALEAKDPDKLLEIVQELNKVLKHEEQVRRDFREAARASNASNRSPTMRIREFRRTELGVRKYPVDMT